MIMNEKIKASEVQLIGRDGEDLGIFTREKAFQIAKEQKLDLVCLSLSESPPPCQLVRREEYQQQKEKAKQKERKQQRGMKTKEIRLTEQIEEHDLHTKRHQAEKILTSGDAVQFTIRLTGKKTEMAKSLIEEMTRDLAHCGKPEKGIQVSGKQVVAIFHPKEGR